MSRQTAKLLLSAANLLTVLRLLATPIVVLVVWRTADSPEFRPAVVLFIIALQATDILDGYLARQGRKTLGGNNRFGQIVDPIADKLYIGAAYLTLGLSGQFHLWFATLVIVRDVSIILGWSFIFYRLGVAIEPNVAGKVADSFQAVFLVLILLDLGPELILLGTVSTAAAIVFSGVSYAMTAYQSAATAGNVKP